MLTRLVWSEEVAALLQAAAGSNADLPRYDDEQSLLVGWLADDVVVAAAGLIITEEEATIGHVAVRPEKRRSGIGSAFVGAIADDLAPLALVAETDVDAVDFYRALGFRIVEIDSPWPTKRYRCMLGTDASSSD